MGSNPTQGSSFFYVLGVVVSLTRPSLKERGSGQTAIVELYISLPMKFSHIHIILDVISGCYRVRVAIVRARHARMHVAVNGGGPSYLLCSQTCTDYRERKRLRADSC